VTPATIVLLLVLLGLVDWAVALALTDVGALLLKGVTLVGFVAYGTRVMRLSSDELGLARRDARRGLVVGLWAALVILAVITVLVAVPASRSHFTSSRVADDSTVAHWVEPLVLIPLATALYEELLFRGVLLGAACRLWRRRAAIAVTSVAFGLWHVPDVLIGPVGSRPAHVAWAALGTVAVTTLAGVLFAVLRLRSRSVVAPFLAHAATNSGAYVAALVALRLSG
jgi:membrane protease YdiL (CAAX protease family)